MLRALVSSIKAHPLIWAGMVVLAIALTGSIGLNWALLRRARHYYLAYNDQRLYPLGLDRFSSEPLKASGTMVVFYGDSRAASWPAPKVPGYTFVNRGIGAQTTQQVRMRFDAHVAPLNPQVVVIQVGINDLTNLALFPEQQQEILSRCEANISSLVAQAGERGATVILTTLFPLGRLPVARRPFWSADVAPAVERVNAHIHSLGGPGVVIMDAFALLASEQGRVHPKYSADLLHLNARGYEVLNAELVRLLAQLE